MATEKCWFTVIWGSNPCNIDGPFGDDVEAARAHLRRTLADPATQADAGGVFAVDLQYVMVTDNTRDADGNFVVKEA